MPAGPKSTGASGMNTWPVGRIKTTTWTLEPGDKRRQTKKTCQESRVKSLFLGSNGCVYKTTTLDPSDWGQ